MSNKQRAVNTYLLLRSIYVHGLVEGLKLGFALFMRRGVAFRPKGYKQALLVRRGTSDAMVAATIFSKLEYKAPRKDKIRTILDLGGNVGYSAVFFCP